MKTYIDGNIMTFFETFTPPEISKSKKMNFKTVAVRLILTRKNLAQDV
jgi:hypothetical protein